MEYAAQARVTAVDVGANVRAAGAVYAVDDAAHYYVGEVV